MNIDTLQRVLRDIVIRVGSGFDSFAAFVECRTLAMSKSVTLTWIGYGKMIFGTYKGLVHFSLQFPLHDTLFLTEAITESL
jgi:hypothetical protein